MAPGLTRWGAIVLLACGAVAIAYLPPRGARAARYRGPAFMAQPLQATPARLRAQGLAEQWRAAHAAVRLAEERERLRGQLFRVSRGAERPVLLLVGADPVPPTVRARVEANLDSVWSALGLAETKVSVAVLIDLGDAVAGAAGVPKEESGGPAYLLPDRAGRTLCLVRIPATTYWRRAISEQRRLIPDVRLRQWLQGTLGPCAFFAAYGAPGRPVRRWLGSRGFDLAAYPVWDASPTSDSRTEESLFWAGGRVWWDYVYHQSPLAVACLAGRETGCRDAVLAGATAERVGDSLPRVVTQERGWWRRQRLLGASRYLADVARDVGPERFREFWNSTLPVDSSLALALRQPVGRWTAAWQLRSAPRLRLGPSAPLSASVLASLLGLGAVAIVAVTSRRRQVR